MTQTEYITLTEDELLDLTESNNVTRSKIISDLFSRLDEQGQSRLLFGFCSGERESYDENPVVDDVSFDTSTEGTIEVSFTGSVYMGCRDMDYVNEHTETLSFEIDHEDAKLWIKSEIPDPPDRPLDDI